MFCLFQGRSDLRVHGVPAQGPGQAKSCDASSPITMLDGLAKSFCVQSLDVAIHSASFAYLKIRARIPENTFPRVPARPYIEKYYRPCTVIFLRALSQFFRKTPSLR
ncbi:hypothetical protein V0M98_00210 [Pseudomonas silesiensis]|jgi:hypothetical protein|uniref:hypothetical protein n=1 Tax=Pseudomonas silesiensis TaxID=1853130 RepID=UPI0030D5EC81